VVGGSDGGECDGRGGGGGDVDERRDVALVIPVILE
jgi:hypothetical protein